MMTEPRAVGVPEMGIRTFPSPAVKLWVYSVFSMPAEPFPETVTTKGTESVPRAPVYGISTAAVPVEPVISFPSKAGVPRESLLTAAAWETLTSTGERVPPLRTVSPV